MQIVVVIGDIIRKRGHLCLGAGVGVQFQIMARVIVSQRMGHVARDRPIVLSNPFEGVPRQV